MKLCFASPIPMTHMKPVTPKVLECMRLDFDFGPSRLLNTVNLLCPLTFLLKVTTSSPKRRKLSFKSTYPTTLHPTPTFSSSYKYGPPNIWISTLASLNLPYFDTLKKKNISSYISKAKDNILFIFFFKLYCIILIIEWVALTVMRWRWWWSKLNM